MALLKDYVTKGRSIETWQNVVGGLKWICGHFSIYIGDYGSEFMWMILLFWSLPLCSVLLCLLFVLFCYDLVFMSYNSSYLVLVN